MKEYENKLKQFRQDNGIVGEHIHFEKTVHTVEDACREANAEPDDFVKTILMVTNDDKLIGAVVPGSCRASTSRVAKALGIERPNVATPEQALEKTGYLVGGIAPFGYEGIILIDPLVLEKDFVYVGGGAPSALTKISTKELLRVTKAEVIRVKK
jgi:Cys-tRNA(Pro)/Cys-tRNA(Cys) deacylase